ncbi:MAG: ABC transporter ATP-binding protein [Cyanobacteria bacterium J06627_8]
MIDVEHLSKVYGATAAIEDVTFAVEPGEILGFLGPNGAGKTTTMRILTGYLPASWGTARVAGFDVHEDSMAVRQHIGYLPETPPLYPDMTVEGFLTFVARIKGVSAGDRPSRVDSALKRCNLEEKRYTLIRKLSKGFRQRVGIAQAIVHDPPVIVLDEPTVGLDPRQIIDVRNLIKSLAGDHTIVLSTHILPEVSMTCNRVAIINRGRVVATNTPEELVMQLQGEVTYELIVSGAFDPVKSALLNIPGVTSVESMAGDTRVTQVSQRRSDDQYVIRATLASGHDVGPEIASVAVRGGLRLFEMKRNQASLEEVFLELTTTEKAIEKLDDTAPTEDSRDSAQTDSSSPRPAQTDSA